VSGDAVDDSPIVSCDIGAKFQFHSEQVAFSIKFAVRRIRHKMSTAAITPDTGNRGVSGTVSQNMF